MTTSKKTSINKDKVPALFRRLRAEDVAGKVIVDYGCGRWPWMAAAVLRDMGAKQVISYDPYNYTSAEIAGRVEEARALHSVDVVCLSNVLNVIPEYRERWNVVRLCCDLLRPGGRLFITVYEGDRSGCGRETMADCWQENRPTADYVRELECIMPGWDVVRHGKLIVVS